MMESIVISAIVAVAVISALIALLRILANSIVKSHVNQLLRCSFGVEVGEVTEVCIDGGKCVEGVSVPLEWCVGKCVNNNIAIISKSKGALIAVKVLKYLLGEGYKVLILSNACDDIIGELGVSNEYATCITRDTLSSYLKGLIGEVGKVAVLVDLRNYSAVPENVMRLTKIASYGEPVLVLLTDAVNPSLAHAVVRDAGLVIEEVDDSSARVKLNVRGRTPKELSVGIFAKALIR